MPGLVLPTDGFKLSALPKPADTYKHNTTAQGVEFELPASLEIEDFEEQGDNKVLARLANSHFELAGGKKIPIELHLHENGYLYRLEDGARTLSLKARLDLRVPEKENAGTDSGMLKLMAGLANAQAEKRSATTAEISLAQAPSQNKRRKLDATAHRRGLFGAHASSRSATGSPNMPPTRDRLALPTISVTREDPLKKAKQEAIRTALIHLVAVRDVSKDYIVRTLGCTASDVEPLLNRHCTPGLVPSKYRLNPKAYQLLDPYGFEYSDDDRREVIDKAIENFDRSRLGPEEKVWQKLLPKEKRGQKICLSRLQKEREAVIVNKQEKLAAREARAAEDDNASRPGSAGSTHSRKELLKHDFSADMQKRKDAAAAHSEKERARNKAATTAKLPKKPVAPLSPAKAPAKKAAEKKSTAPPSGKIKSAEFITESDEEEVEAELKLSEPSPRPAARDSAPKKEVAKPSKPSVPAIKKTEPEAAAHKPIEKATARAADKPKAAKTSSAGTPKPVTSASSTTTASSLSRPTTRPAALDRQKLAAKPITTPNASSQPSTPKSGTMPLTVPKRPLVTKKISVPVTSTGSSSRATSATGKAAPRDTTNVVTKEESKVGTKDTPRAPAKAAEKLSATKPATSRDASQKTVPKRNPNLPPKKYEPEKKSEPVKKPVNGEMKAKLVTSKPSTTASKAATTAPKQDKPRAAPPKPSAASQSKKADSVKAPAMQKSYSHQRKSSSPIKPSPLASSPPISASDIDEYRGSAKNSASATPLKRPASTVAQKPNPKVPRREAPTSQPSKIASDGDRAPKRKASEVDSSSTTHGAAASGTFERPAKRRETGSIGPRSIGASGSNAASKTANTDNNSLKAKADNERADSHSPSPASSTIGSTSTKGTSMSMMSASSSIKDNSKGKQVARDTEKTGDRIKGFDRHDLDRAAKFEKEMEAYNKLQREVALMGDNAPLEKIRDLNQRFNNLEYTKRTLAMLAKSNC